MGVAHDQLKVLPQERIDLLRLLPGYDPFATAGDYYFDEAASERVMQFFRDCVTHVKGPLAGKPYIPQPHEESLLRNLFGWKQPNGYRRYRQCLYYVARKNSKTTLGTGILLYMLVADGEMGAEDYSAAADKEQASHCLWHCQGHDSKRRGIRRSVSFQSS